MNISLDDDSYAHRVAPEWMPDGNKCAIAKASFDSLLSNKLWETQKLHRNILAVGSTPFREVVYEEVGQVASVVWPIGYRKQYEQVIDRLRASQAPTQFRDVRSVQ